jgi:hypothetical protein
MADVFSRASQNLTGVIPVDAAKIAFSADNTVFGVGLLTQNITVNYAQQINRIYEIGTNNTYFIGGRTQGQLGIGRVIGPKAVQVAFYRKYGNMCNAPTNNINLTTGTEFCNIQGPPRPGQTSVTGSPSTFSIKFAVITNIGITVNANDMIVNETLNLMYVSLEIY